MSLYNGLDITAIAANGKYTETYGSGAPANIANLYASLGYLEDAPNVSFSVIRLVMYLMRRFSI